VVINPTTTGFLAGAMTLKEAFLVTFGEMVDAWCFWKRQGLAQFDVFCCLRLMDLQHGNLECEFWNSV